MDLRVLVLTADAALGTLIKAQVDNLGCRCTVATDYAEASTVLTWADAGVVDLADGLDDLRRLRDEAPSLRVVAVAPEGEIAAQAVAEGAFSVLVEPFSISDVVELVRGLGRGAEVGTVDLREGALTQAAATAEDKPWWATR